MDLAPSARDTEAATQRSSSDLGPARAGAGVWLRERRDAPAAGCGGSRISEALLQRVCGEFLEMPGLCLTRQQAQRLWGLDESTCFEILDFLVATRFLHHSADRDAYSRLTDGSARPPRLRADDTARPIDGPDRFNGTA
jgi:hypothetical protein